MKLTELIEQLAKYKQANGDIPVYLQVGPSKTMALNSHGVVTIERTATGESRTPYVLLAYDPPAGAVE